MPMQNSMRQIQMKSSFPRARTRNGGKPAIPSPSMITPMKQAIRRLMTASRVMNASPTARRGGMMDVQ